MIRLRLKGRLGNQLFIYAFARALSFKYDQPVLIYDRCGEKDITWHSQLNEYCLSDNVTLTKNKKEIMEMSIKQKCLFYLDRVLGIMLKSARKKRILEDRLSSRYIKEGLFICTDGYKKLPKKISGDLFCDGYFQSEKYFKDIREIILKDLRLRKPLSKKNEEFVSKMQKSNSVCVSIRLGDYLNNPVHDICNIAFYLKAMEKMHEIYNDCLFFIFSDDITMVKKTFDFKYPVVFDEGLNSAPESLRCMSFCKHYIIANSSFSWWAQYLSISKDKIVIAPSKWYLIDIPCDIYQDNWILM